MTFTFSNTSLDPMLFEKKITKLIDFIWLELEVDQFLWVTHTSNYQVMSL